MRSRYLISVLMVTLSLLSLTVSAIPTVMIDSPDNITYDTVTIDLNWSVDENLVDASYSLNDAVNVSIIDTYQTGGDWVGDSEVISGLSSTQLFITPDVFYKDTTWYMIYGELYGSFHGFNWTGNAWQVDNMIVSGATGILNSVPDIFQMDGTWYIISGEADGSFRGFNWTGSDWQADISIYSGLGDIGSNSAPIVFQRDGTWYLITGDNLGTFHGFNWTGSSWQADPILVSGLGDIGSNSAPSIFQDSGIWYMISGNNLGVYHGFNWTGNSWQADPYIVQGISNAGYSSVPSVFQRDSNWYLISGMAGGTFLGFNLSDIVYHADILNKTIIAQEGSNTLVIYATNTSASIGLISVTFTVDLPTEPVSALDSGKRLGEVPAGVILGLTENVTISEAILFVIIAVIVGLGIFWYISLKGYSSIGIRKI